MCQCSGHVWNGSNTISLAHTLSVFTYTQSCRPISSTLFNPKSATSISSSSLTIMFACNLLRKIKFSKFYEQEKQISSAIETFVQKETTLNQDIISSDSGKFLIIAIVKYCICLSIENANKNEISKYRIFIDKLTKHYLIIILYVNIVSHYFQFVKRF